MLVLWFAFFALVCSVAAPPPNRRYDDVYDSYGGYGFPYSMFPSSFPFTGARAYSGVGTFPGAGTFSGAGFPFFTPVPYPFYIPMPQLPDFSKFIPWYKGNNVCETTKVIEEPDEMKEWLNEGFEGSFNYNHESQSCKGDNDKYVCLERIQTNEGSKMKMTKYQCCYGFVRATDGNPGCVESSKVQNSGNTATDISANQYRVKEQYSFVNKNDNKGDKSGVGTVPIQ